MKPVQHFSDEYLAHSATLTPRQTLQFLEDFRQLHAARLSEAPQRSVLISLRVPESLLRAFRTKAKAEGVAYQTKIKQLMEAWISTLPPS